jgi:hypothetical protein
VALDAVLGAGESLRHVIYSLAYDAEALAYLGMQPGSKARDWGFFDNPDQRGVAHGIVHFPAGAAALQESGEVVVFRFRVRRADAASRLEFTRLKTNDVDVQVPAIDISEGGRAAAQAAPARYALRCQPNPFNPSTRIRFAIPAGAGQVPVNLRIYDIAGRLVRSLVQADFGPGEHLVPWDGRTDTGQVSGAGIYVVRIKAGTWAAIEKMTLVK